MVGAAPSAVYTQFNKYCRVSNVGMVITSLLLLGARQVRSCIYLRSKLSHGCATKKQGEIQISDQSRRRNKKLLPFRVSKVRIELTTSALLYIMLFRAPNSCQIV